MDGSIGSVFSNSQIEWALITHWMGDEPLKGKDVL